MLNEHFGGSSAVVIAVLVVSIVVVIIVVVVAIVVVVVVVVVTVVVVVVVVAVMPGNVGLAGVVVDVDVLLVHFDNVAPLAFALVDVVLSFGCCICSC